VIKLHPDNWEEVVQDGLSQIEAEILCEAKIADMQRPATLPASGDDPTESLRNNTRNRRPSRQLALKF
jgi:hypothetical protein